MINRLVYTLSYFLRTRQLSHFMLTCILHSIFYSDYSFFIYRTRFYNSILVSLFFHFLLNSSISSIIFQATPSFPHERHSEGLFFFLSI
ncbi:hypothetical protein CW304_03820 [Bacillus sp. UFRGS-B20]|nr:hypothetical protein CW304_03820 [Bacillus sp. UFRGS-B20]